MLGHEVVGSGPLRVVVLNDWICDTSSWSDARRYLDDARFTWAFADVRGYGRSLDRQGAFNLSEIVADVLALSSTLGWERFAVVGHSMTCLAALQLAQNEPRRIERAVVLTPPPLGGLGFDAETFAALEAAGRGDEAARRRTLDAMCGDRLSERWVRFKLQRWRETSAPEAVARYLAMFARDGLPDRTTRITPPVLAVTGEQDGEPMRRAHVAAELGPLCERLTLAPLADCGHYPMQEAPPLLVTLVERFLSQSAPSR